MATLALYLAKPEQLSESVGLITLAYVVLCFCAWRLKLSVPVAAMLMAGGCGLALLPDLRAAAGADLGQYGDIVRKESGTQHSDAFFAITTYFCVGRGQLVALAGMSIPLLIHAGFAAARASILRRRNSAVALRDRSS